MITAEVRIKSLTIIKENLQQIPSNDPSIRLMFKASPGCKFVSADFSAQEPRVTAFLSGDEKMRQAFDEDKDLYPVIAQQIYDVPYEDCLEFYPEGREIEIEGKKIVCGYKTHTNKEGKHRRKLGKTILLAITYGMSVKTMAEKIGKSMEEAQVIMDKFFDSFPGVKKWLEDTKEFVFEHGYVKGILGRRRHFPEVFEPDFTFKLKHGKEIDNFNPLLESKTLSYTVDRATQDKYIKKFKSVYSKEDRIAIEQEAEAEGIIAEDNRWKKSSVERQGVNAPIQGSAATLTKLAMIAIDNDEELNKLGFKLLITIHDEVLGECPEENAKAAEKRLAEVMVSAAKDYIDVPQKVDPTITTNWYEDQIAVIIQEEYSDYLDEMPEAEAFEKIKEEHIEFNETKLRQLLEV